MTQCVIFKWFTTNNLNINKRLKKWQKKVWHQVRTRHGSTLQDSLVNLSHLLEDKSFINQFKTDKKHFTRDRKLSFKNTVLFPCLFLQSDLQNELNLYFEKQSSNPLQCQHVDKSAYSHARRKFGTTEEGIAFDAKRLKRPNPNMKVLCWIRRRWDCRPSSWRKKPAKKSSSHWLAS